MEDNLNWDLENGVTLELTEDQYAGSVIMALDGKPVAAARPRARAMGKIASVYTCPKYAKNKKALEKEIKDAFAGDPYDEAVLVVANYFFIRPKTVKRDHCSVKPDLDNLDKALLDSLVKAKVLSDDAKVIAMYSNKQYSETGKEVTAVMIVPIEP